MFIQTQRQIELNMYYFSGEAAGPGGLQKQS